MTSPEITDAAVEARQTFVVEKDASGAFIVTSPDIRGLLIARMTFADAVRQIPEAVEALANASPAALPHLAAGRAEAVAVKPLEWRKYGVPSRPSFKHVEEYYLAHPDLSYSITRSRSGFFVWLNAPFGCGHGSDFGKTERLYRISINNTLEAAKAAAQQDYDQRIRSALVFAPAAPIKPTATWKLVNELCVRLKAASEYVTDADDSVEIAAAIQAAHEFLDASLAAPSPSQEALREALEDCVKQLQKVKQGQRSKAMMAAIGKGRAALDAALAKSAPVKGGE